MARKPALTVPPPLAARPGDVTREVDLQVVTPLCGGGVRPHQNDPTLLVRGTAVRGHLRFWWRAARAGEFKTTAELRAAEAAIWGSTDLPAKVQVEVRITDVGREGRDIRQFSDDEVPAYVAFPLTSRGMTGRCREDIAFRLALRYPAANARDIEAALWAWTTFGGLGARTRRGFGALAVTGATTSLDEIHRRLADEAFVAQHEPPEAGVPSLYGARTALTKESAKNDILAWYDAVYKLQDFRQARREGRAQNRPGRSFWCEPDTIRRLKNQAAPAHREPVNDVRAFPRAVFGLPLIYQFKDAKEGDPRPQSLSGGLVNRLASPIVLRPVRTTGNAHHGLALRLANTFLTPEGLVPGNLSLAGTRVEHRLSREQVDQLKRQANLPRPLTYLEPDVLAGFMAWFAD